MSETEQLDRDKEHEEYLERTAMTWEMCNWACDMSQWLEDEAYKKQAEIRGLLQQIDALAKETQKMLDVAGLKGSQHDFRRFYKQWKGKPWNERKEQRATAKAKKLFGSVRPRPRAKCITRQTRSRRPASSR
ncbi:MAG TPA: hypothetical protein VF600_08930 [Abditibacteriaceae bacterium]|jgi:hypothetical protein